MLDRFYTAVGSKRPRSPHKHSRSPVVDSALRRKLVCETDSEIKASKRDFEISRLEKELSASVAQCEELRSSNSFLVEREKKTLEKMNEMREERVAFEAEQNSKRIELIASFTRVSDELAVLKDAKDDIERKLRNEISLLQGRNTGLLKDNEAIKLKIEALISEV